MNAMTKVAPPMTAERLIAVVKVLPPLKTMPIDRRERIEAAIRQCEKDASFDDDECDLYAYFREPFRLDDAPGWDDLEAGEDGAFADQAEALRRCSAEFDEDAQEIWWDHIRDAVATPKDPWNYLLDEAERMVPDFSRWSLPGARFSLVGEAISAPAAPLQLLSFDDDENSDIASLNWTLANVWQENSLGVVVGAPGECKTTMALAVALHIAAGRPFAGREVLQGAVVYVAAEGHVGAIKARVRTMKAEYGMHGALPLHLVDRAVNLLKPADVDSLVASITGITGPVRAVIFDTLPRCMVGGDENSAQAMGQVVASMERVRDAFGAAVVALTHPARGGLEARGSSALEGAVDTRINVSTTREGGTVKTVVLKVNKQKNGQDGDKIVFDMKLDPAALVPLYREADTTTPAAPVAPKAKLSVKGKLALAFLVKHGPSTEDTWRVAVAGQITSSTEGKAQRQAFYRVRDELKAAGAVILGADNLWRTGL